MKLPFWLYGLAMDQPGGCFCVSDPLQGTQLGMPVGEYRMKDDLQNDHLLNPWNQHVIKMIKPSVQSGILSID